MPAYRDAFTEELDLEQMTDKVCDMAYGLLRSGHGPIVILDAMINATLKFGGIIGENAIQKRAEEARTRHPLPGSAPRQMMRAYVRGDLDDPGPPAE